MGDETTASLWISGGDWGGPGGWRWRDQRGEVQSRSPKTGLSRARPVPALFDRDMHLVPQSLCPVDRLEVPEIGCFLQFCHCGRWSPNTCRSSGYQWITILYYIIKTRHRKRHRRRECILLNMGTAASPYWQLEHWSYVTQSPHTDPSQADSPRLVVEARSLSSGHTRPPVSPRSVSPFVSCPGIRGRGGSSGVCVGGAGSPAALPRFSRVCRN